MMDYEVIINGIIKREDGYVDHPADRGGPTNYGITQAVARENGWKGDMRDLPLALARSIYRARYITTPRFDAIVQISERIGAELIDTGVNMGPQIAATFIQRWLNAFNTDGSRYADVFVDGRIGSVTLRTLQAYLAWRGADGEAVMLAALNSTQGERYLEIAERDLTQRAFIYGQVRARVLQPAL